MALLAVLGGISAGLGILSGISGIGRQKKADKIQAQKDAMERTLQKLELEQQKGQAQIAIQETQSNISAYESFLERYPEYAKLEEEKYKASGEQEYRELMRNYGMVNVLAGASGRTGAGTSIAQVGALAMGDVKQLVGEDMSLDTEGGLYGMGLQELSANLALEQRTAEQQLDIYRTSLDALEESTLGINKALRQLENWEEPESGGFWKDLWGGVKSLFGGSSGGYGVRVKVL